MLANNNGVNTVSLYRHDSDNICYSSLGVVALASRLIYMLPVRLSTLTHVDGLNAFDLGQRVVDCANLD